jgi:hypothetical protein
MDAPARQRQAASESDFLDGILNCFGHRVHRNSVLLELNGRAPVSEIYRTVLEAVNRGRRQDD